MSFSRLSLTFRLHVVILICSQLGFYGGTISQENLFFFSAEEIVVLGDRDDQKDFDDGLNVTAFSDPAQRRFNKVSLAFGFVPQGVTLELHATGPPPNA